MTRTPRRAVVLLAITSAAVALVASGRPWVRVDLTGLLTGTPEAAVPGSDVAPLVPAVALVGLAAAAAVAIAGRRGARLAGTAVLLAGAGVVLGSLVALGDPASAAAASLARTTGGVATPAGAASDTAWPVVAAAAGLVLAACGAGALLLAPRWAAARTFEPARGDGRSARTSTAGRPGSDWDALTRGLDPTAAPRADDDRD